MNKLSASLHPLERKVLPALAKAQEVNALVKLTGLQQVEVVRALQWLENKKLVTMHKKEEEVITLGKNGKLYKEKGLPERRVLKELAEKSKSINEIDSVSKEELGIALGVLKKKQAILMGEPLALTPTGTAMLSEEWPEETFLHQEPLSQDNPSIKELSKRKDILNKEVTKVITASLTAQGKKILEQGVQSNMVDSLTPDSLIKGTWKDKTFRRYDVEINVPTISGGNKHFVNEAMAYAKRIWMDMGFQEMTGSLVQTSFWNFDALFTPQDHPVRDMQDTFFVNTKGKLPNPKLVREVKEAHEYGVAGSKGWNSVWQEEEAQKPVLRTHTTVLSAHTIAQFKGKQGKFFALGRCFRNETLDWSHLFEFNQTEGIVIDKDANFRHLLGYLKTFFAKMGFPKARFRPAYFPYTEPSVEIDVYHEGKKTWLELGGAGVLRPEVVIPLLGEDIPVLAWGPGFDRLILDFHNIADIRELYKNDLKQLRSLKTWTK